MSQQPPADHDDLETLVMSSARAFDYPRTPGIASRVLARLDEEPITFVERLRSIMAGRPMRYAAAAIAAVIVATTAALVTPQSREALADFFGLSRVEVEVVGTESPAPPILHPASFAEPTTLDAAQDSVDFSIRLPTSDGARLLPDAVYMERASDAQVVIAVYEGHGFDLYQSDTNLFGKGVPDEDALTETLIDGREALWIAGGGHIARSLDEEGRVLIQTERTVERATLLWEEGSVTYRLETDLSLEDATAVAESLR